MGNMNPSWLVWSEAEIKCTVHFADHKLLYTRHYSLLVTALKYKPRILGPNFLVLVHKLSVILTALDYKPH